MATEVRLHIGPVKTGTTTIQGTLSRRREELHAMNVLYPRPANHSVSVSAQWARWEPDGPPWSVAPAARRYTALSSSFADAVTSHPGPVIISAEWLCSLSEAGVRGFVKALRVPVHVVLVDRRVSQSIPSWHAESIKLRTPPRFEDHARIMLASLLEPGRTHYDFLNIDKLAGLWRAQDVDVTVVEARPDLSAEVLREVIAQLAPELADPEVGDAANKSMSALGARIWRDHAEAAPPRLAATGIAVRNRMLQEFPCTADPALGGRLALTPEVGDLADTYMAGSPLAGRQLRRRLESDDPVTEPTPEGGSERIHAALRRWQRRESVKWEILGVGSRLTGRGPLIPGEWDRREC